eukprot:CAMPEP_0201135282 /NCGR_PEP_ID=MMETSP0850-20130426/54084_1 /ASSEMBLY_ACC=CAM_ASM_000622 /TAXON_ID=183588 /ORGANISM="Pseudo-nitzschia fraudulenta, Strain WWA7" /LENGTH=32 /DNA_ID= /DNA_START= /DNA_END= /DNA_ORIENTATION=
MTTNAMTLIQKLRGTDPNYGFCIMQQHAPVTN